MRSKNIQFGWTNSTVDLTNSCRIVNEEIVSIAFSSVMSRYICNVLPTADAQTVRIAFRERTLYVLTVRLRTSNIFVHAQNSSTHCAKKQRSGTFFNELKTTFNRRSLLS